MSDNPKLVIRVKIDDSSAAVGDLNAQILTMAKSLKPIEIKAIGFKDVGVQLDNITTRTKIATDGTKQWLDTTTKLTTGLGKTLTIIDNQSGAIEKNTTSLEKQRGVAERAAKQRIQYEELWKKLLIDREAKEDKLAQKEAMRVANLGQYQGAIPEGSFGNRAELEKYILSMQEAGTVVTKFGGIQQTAAGAQIRLSLATNTGNNMFKEQKIVVDQATGAFYQLENSIKPNINRMLGLVEQMGIAISRTITWGIAMGTIYGNLRKLREGIELIKELDASLVQIQMVTGMTVAETRKLADGYMELAASMRVSVRDVTASAVSLFRQGLSMSQVEERLIAVSKTAKTTGVDLVRTTDFITAGVNSTKMVAEDYADVLLKAASISGTSFEELGDGMSKVVSAAAVSGVAVQKLTSWLSTLSETTRLSASTLGQSTKTWIARFNRVNEETGELNEDLNTVQTAVESVGIAFLDSEKQIRPVSDILDELAPKWSTLDKNTQQYLSTQIAGVRQISNFQALMSNYNRSLEINNELLYAGGTLNVQYGKYLNSVEASAMKAKTAFEQMWMNAMNSSVIKGFYEMSAALTSVVKSIGLLNTVVFTLTTVMLVSSGAFRKWLATATATTIGTSVLTGVMAIFKNGLIALNTVFDATAVKMAAVTLGLSVAISFLVNGITKLVAAQAEAREATREFEQSQLDSANLYGRNQKAIADLQDRYEKLTSKINKSSAETEELQSVQNELGKLLPNIVENVDEYGNAHLRASDEIENEIARLKELRQAYDLVETSTFTDIVNERTKAVQRLSAEIEKLSTYSATVIPVFANNSDDINSAEPTYYQSIESAKELAFRMRDLRNTEAESAKETAVYNDKLLAQTRAKARLSGVTGQLTSDEEKYILTLFKQNQEQADTIDGAEKLIANVIDMGLRRDELNAIINDSSKSLSVEHIAIENRLKDMGLEIDLTQKLTDATKQLLKTQLIANHTKMSEMSMGEARYLSAQLMELEKMFEFIDKLYVKPLPSGGDGKLVDTFDLSARKLELVNAQLDALKDSLETITDIEQRQTIYDKMITTYQQKQTILSQMLTWQKQQLTTAQATLRSSVNASDYNKIISGDFSNLDVYKESTSKAIEAFQKLASEVLKTESAIREVELATLSLGNTAQKEIADNYSKWLSDTTQIANDVVDAYKEMYRQQKDMRLKENREALEAENARHKTVIDNLSEQLDAYTEVINAKLKTLDREEDAESYEKQLTKEQTARQELLNKIDILSLDDSVEGRTRLAELNKQLADQNETIAEMQSKRQKDLRKENLKDQLDAYKTDIDAKKDAETAKFDAAKLRLDQEKDAWTNYYDNLISDERKWSSVRQSIMDGDKTKIDTILTDLKNQGFPNMVSELDSQMVIAGKSIQENLIDKLFAARAALSAINYNVPTPSGVGGVGQPIPTTPTQTSATSLRDFASQQGVPLGYNEATDTVTFGSKGYSKSQLESLGLYLKDGRWYGSGSALGSLKPFHTGGMPNLPEGKEGLALVTGGEPILNKYDTKNLLSAVRILDNIIPRFSTPQLAGAGAGGPITLNFTVDKMYGTDKEAKGFATKIISELTKSGITAPVRRG